MLLKQDTHNKKPILGIGGNLTKTFNQNFGFNKNLILSKLKYKQKNNLNFFIKKLPTGRKLKDNTSSFFNFIYNIKTYKGLRHKLKYPCRGQRTHTNAKTKKKFNY